VLARARSASLGTIIITGSSLRSSKAAMQLVDAAGHAGHAAQSAAPNSEHSTAAQPPSLLPQLFFTAGVHPHNAKVSFKEVHSHHMGHVLFRWPTLTHFYSVPSMLPTLLRFQECDATTLSTLRSTAAHPRAVAIGECGLDFNRDFSPRDVQEHWFAAQARIGVHPHC
jgi:TatD DNase family protein